MSTMAHLLGVVSRGRRLVACLTTFITVAVHFTVSIQTDFVLQVLTKDINKYCITDSRNQYQVVR